MNYTQDLTQGMVYILEDYTAPKVFTGLYFECLVTDQRIPAHAKVEKKIGVLEYSDDIYKPERFFRGEMHK